MARIYFGINTSSNLAQVSNNIESLKNLNLDINDLDVIRGLADTGVTRDDLKNISNLDLDIKAELISVSGGTNRYNMLTDEIETFKDIQPANLWMNSQIAASAIKYNYIDYSTGDIKSADISTSRISSWSSFDSPVTLTSPIFYGGDLQIVKNTTTDESELRATGINVIDSPEPIRFASEVATHVVTIDINGSPKQIYMMRGIPLTFLGFFKNANFRIQISRLNSNSPFPSWLITNQDNNIEYVYEDIGTNTSIQFSDFTSRERKLQFYYDPNRILRVIVPSLNISEFPNITMPLAIEVNTSFNDLREIPIFNSITPTLQSLNISGNNLSRSSLTGNQQLSTLPTTLLTLQMDGTFSDNEFIDLSYLTNLRTLVHNSYYTKNNFRRMTHTGSTHAVGTNIQNYSIRNHRYTELHTSLATAEDLRTLDISNNNITRLNGDVLGDNQIKLASLVLTNFFSDVGNNHNVVNVSGKNLLQVYRHRQTSTLVGDSSIEGKFNSCESLNTIDFYACRCTGEITNTFTNLPSLRTLDIRFTTLSGRLSSTTFSGTNSLQNLYISGGSFDDSNFFDEDVFYNTLNLRSLLIYSNRNIGGSLPDFTKNTTLNNVYISDTGITGNLPTFRQNINLRNLTIRNGRTKTLEGLNGPMPAIFNPNVQLINFQNNSIVSSISQPFPELECEKLRTLNLSGNLLSGPITSFGKCPSLRDLNLSSNQFNSYTSGAILNNLFLTKVDLSNNSLTKFDVYNLIQDLMETWNLNKRSNVQIILIGNNFTANDINSDEVAINTVNFLRNQGWSIIF